MGRRIGEDCGLPHMGKDKDELGGGGRIVEYFRRNCGSFAQGLLYEVGTVVSPNLDIRWGTERNK